MELKEHCGNCDFLLWHDMRIQYERNKVHRLVQIPNPVTGSCTEPLMKRHKKCRDVTKSECLFWKGGVR